jgi:hypothetical protein
MGGIESAEILRSWASLVRPEPSSWLPLIGLIRCAEAEAQKLESRLTQLVGASDTALQAISLCDPLLAHAGLNRWLKKEREEAYSDWLAWSFEQLGALDILHVLGLTEPEIVASVQSHAFKIEREFYIPDGRLDLLLTLENFLMVILEVKKSSARKHRALAERHGLRETDVF